MIAQQGYVVENQPTIPDNDPFRIRYPRGDPDYRIEGRYFDLYSPMSTTPARNIADNVDDKLGRQVDRVIIEFPADATPEQIQQAIDAIQGLRDTPDTATRTRLEELWFIIPDRAIEKVFPSGRLR